MTCSARALMRHGLFGSIWRVSGRSMPLRSKPSSDWSQAASNSSASLGTCATRRTQLNEASSASPSLWQRIHIENPHGFVRVMQVIDHESSCTDGDQRTGRSENGGHVSGPDTASRADTVL